MERQKKKKKEKNAKASRLFEKEKDSRPSPSSLLAESEKKTLVYLTANYTAIVTRRA